MDKVKAIKVLKPLVDSYVDYANISMTEKDDDVADALEMALEALKALDVPDTKQLEPDWNEIMVICDNCGHAINVRRENCKVSAQPEIIHCKDCKHSSPNGKYGCKSYHYRLYETHEMKPDDFCSFAERRTDG